MDFYFQNTASDAVIEPSVTASNHNSNQFLSFDTAKVQTITLEQLSRTHQENDVYNNPLRGIYHYDLINRCLEMCSEAGYSADVWDLFAAQNKERQSPGVVLLPEVERQYGERAIEAHILRRVFANVRLTDFDDSGYTTNLAIAFHQKGIQVGFGNAVVICHNQCMLNAKQYISTYSERGSGRRSGDDKVTVPQVLDTVKSWLFDARHIVVAERGKIERMKSIQVDADTLLRLIGLLNVIRVKCDTTNKCIKESRVYPLNQAQITKFTEDLLIRYDEKRVLTVWDLYNCATELYKANSMDIPSMLPQNRAMALFLDEQFGL